MDFTYYYCEEKEGGFVDIVYGICLSSFLIFLRCWYLILGLFVHLAVMGGVHTADALTKAKAACPMLSDTKNSFLLYSCDQSPLENLPYHLRCQKSICIS